MHSKATLETGNIELIGRLSWQIKNPDSIKQHNS